ncbi:membrane protein [Yersinia pekkanenii]|uniref:Membrane protein n=1 Tax=Yersinia pekkanenii TaxID=1288385 RepID=A0A0T9RLL5_9GAMM|nr:membrane protein [Yersinia pekkanenii]CRY64319.1 membrane protein [Yersinia pekkanenii]
MIFCENTAYQFGIQDFGAVVVIISGRNNLSTRTKPRDAIEGTSYASRHARKVFGNNKFPFGMRLPTWIGGYTPWTAKRKMVAKIGTFVGRTIPLIGIIIIASDVSQIVYRSVRDYNMIARGNDKIW